MSLLSKHLTLTTAGTVATLSATALVNQAYAAGLGIPFDSFIINFTQFIIGLGLPVGFLGLLGWAGAHLNNTFGTMIGGSINLFATAGLLGGGAAIMAALGLVAGATLPL